MYHQGMKRLITPLFLLLAFLGTFSEANAAAANKLRFSDFAEIEGLKLIVPLPQGARENPLKPVEVLRYSLSNGQQTWIEDRSSALDLWAESQAVACWVDPYENVLTLARMNEVFPPGLEGMAITREAFENVMRGDQLKLDRDSKPETLAFWVSHFCGGKVTETPETLRINTSRITTLLKFKLEDPRTLAYAFRLNPGYPGQANAPHHWFALVLNLAELPNSDTDRLINDQLLGALKTTSSFEGTRARSVRKNRTQGALASVTASPSRARAQRSIEFLSDWWFMDSPNYIMISDHKSAEQFSGILLNDLEGLRPYFEQAIPHFAIATDMIGVLRLFQNESDFMAYLGEGVAGLDVQNTGGIFSGNRRELVIRPTSNVTSVGEGSIRSIIKHEGFHQYAFAAMGGISPSIWLNEGFACFFENCEVDRYGKLTINESRRFAKTIESLLKNKSMDWNQFIPAFLMVEPQAFYSNPEINYAVAYGLVYYLMRGAPLERNKPYATVLPAYLEELERSGDPNAATKAAFAKVDLKKFTDDFVRFWKTTKSRQDAQRKVGL